MERKVFTIQDWKNLFPGFFNRGNLLERMRARIKPGSEEELRIGEIREKMVMQALETMKEQGKIRDYIRTEKLGYQDLISGVDFIITYVNDKYRACHFSVTGPNWVEKHREKHPEIPVISIKLNENQESIKEKILALTKENYN